MYDIIILGAGPGGYVAAERAGHAGLKVLLIEKEHLGGVCLNSGCIPTKTLLSSAKNYAHREDAAKTVYPLETAMAHKTRVIETLRKGIAAQMKRFHVETLTGEGRLINARTVRVAGKDYTAKNIILATGSSTAVPPIPGINGPRVMTSDKVLSITEIPKKVVIVGGGYIGMEFASYFSMIGVPVTVIEMMDEIIPMLEKDFAVLLRKSIPGIEYELGAKVEEFTDDGVVYSKNGEKKKIEADIVLVSIGRRPNVTGMGFEEAGLDLEKKGIKVDEKMKTNLPSVYAIGDVNGLSLLAHSASRMGEVAVNTILGRKDLFRGHAVPWVVFTNPEVAGCGLTEADAKQRGIEVKTATVPLRLSGRYLAEHPKENGMCRVVVDKKSDVILGITILGSGCSEMIFGAALLVELEVRAKDVRDIIFPHPTVSEVLREAMFALAEQEKQNAEKYDHRSGKSQKKRGPHCEGHPH